MDGAGDANDFRLRHEALHKNRSNSKFSFGASGTASLFSRERCPCAPCFLCPAPLEFLVVPRKLGDSLFLRVWDCVCCVALIYVCFATPIEVAFLDVVVNAQFFVNIAISMLFLGDMLLQFVVPVTMIVPERGLQKVYAKKLIRRNYLKTWFAIDLVSILPFDTLSLAVDSSETSFLGHIRVLRLLKLLRLVKGLRIWRRYATDLAWSYRKMMLAQLFLTVIVVAHWFSCILGAVSRFGTGDEEVCIGTDDPWQENGRCFVAWISKALVGIGTHRNSDDKVPFANSYSISLLTAVTILVHPFSAQIVPVNVWETLLFTGMVLLGGLLWTRVISKSTGMFTSLDRHNILYHQMMDDMNDMMGSLGLHPKHKFKLRAFFMRMRDLSRQDTWAQIKDRMSPTLRREVTWETNKTWARRVPCLVGCTHVMITEVAEALKSHRFAHREYFGEPYNLYIMQLGKATRWTNKSALGLQVKSPGDFWGEEHIMLSTPELMNSNIALAVSYVEVKSISRDQFDTICENHPENWQCLKLHYLRYVFQAGVWYYKELVGKADHSLRHMDQAIAKITRTKALALALTPAEICILSHRLGDQVDDLEKAQAAAAARRELGFEMSAEGSITFAQGQLEDQVQQMYHARRARKDVEKKRPQRRLCFLDQLGSERSPRLHQLTASKEVEELKSLRRLLDDQGKKVEEEVEAIRREVQEKAFVLSAQQRALMELIQQRWPVGPYVQRPGHSRQREEPSRAPKRRSIFGWKGSPQAPTNGLGHSQNEVLQVRVGVIGESRGANTEEARAGPSSIAARSGSAMSSGERESTEDTSVGSDEVHGSPINTMVFDLPS